MHSNRISVLREKEERNKKINILLVDDSVLNQRVACALLTKCGFRVTTANNGREAVEIIKNKTFQFILMDLQMPEMDGCEATKKIRAMTGEYFKSLPIFSFSTAIAVDEKEKAIQIGMTDVAVKPLNADDLEDKIVKYLTNI